MNINKLCGKKVTAERYGEGTISEVYVNQEGKIIISVNFPWRCNI